MESRIMRFSSGTGYEDCEQELATSIDGDPKWSKAKTLLFILVFCSLSWAGIGALALSLF